MPDGKPTRRRRERRRYEVDVWMPASMKRDLARLAKEERLPLSRFCCGLLRLGIGRYFELSDARRVAPLLDKLRDVFTEDAPFPPMPEIVRKKFEAVSR